MDFEKAIEECADKESSAILFSSINITIKNILLGAKMSAERRNSTTIREKDIKTAIQTFKSLQPKVPRFYRIPVAGKGACLFISMRLCLEMNYIESQIDLKNPPKSFCLDGQHEALETAGHALRLKCVDWFARKYDADVPELGSYVENGRLYVRGDLPALEMVKKGIDVPESGPERLKIIQEYLQTMSLPKTWGSSPEYTAVSIMTKKTINIWQIKNALQTIDSIVSLENEDDFEEDDEINDTTDNTLYEDEHFEKNTFEEIDDGSKFAPNLNLLFVGGCHYEALITRSQYMKLIGEYGLEYLKNIQPLKEPTLKDFLL